MIIRKLYFFIIGLFAIVGYSQVEEPTSGDNGINNVLSNITPPSPQAYSMTRYGDVTVDDFVGNINTSIPIYNYTVGKFSMPISLNYVGSGIKVNDISTWTGINWTLLAGGVITRTVKDLADETAAHRFNLEKQELLDMSASDCSPGSQDLYNICVNDVYDTEFDTFNFSFPGYSGSFYIGEDLSKGILYKRSHNLIIDTSEFQVLGIITITAPNGIKYVFGGNGAIESTVVSSGARVTSIPNRTSFYLSKIIFPNAKIISFEYETGINHSYTYSLNSKQIFTEYLNTETGLMNYSSGPVSTSGFVTNVIEPKFLKKITNNSTNEIVQFFSSNYSGSENITRVLNYITISKGSGALFKRVDLNYIGLDGVPADAKRFFLEKVEFNTHVIENSDGGTNKKEIFTMVYNSPEDLPERLSFDQDLMGYYNGVNNNQALMSPCNIIPWSPEINGYVNRYPNYNYASKGVLTDIYYPTGGKTHFEYEPNYFKEKVNMDFWLEAYRNRGDFHQNSLTTGLPYFDDQGEIGEEVFGDPIPFDQNVDIYVVLDVPSQAPDTEIQITHGNERATLTIWDMDLPISQGETFLFQMSDGMSPSLQTFPPVPYFFRGGHRYRIELEIYDPSSSSTIPVPLNAVLQFKIVTGYRKANGYGVNLKSVADYSDEETMSNYKRYYFRNMENVVHEDITLYPELTEILPDVTLSMETWAQTAPLFLTYYIDEDCSYSDASSRTNGKIPHEYVTISYGGDNFEIGGVEKRYSLMPNFYPTRIRTVTGNYFSAGAPVIPTTGGTGLTNIGRMSENISSKEVDNHFFQSGDLLTMKTYKKQNGSLFKIQETNNTYNRSIFSEEISFVGKPIVGLTDLDVSCNGQFVRPLSSCYLGYYSVYSFEDKLVLTETKNFIEPIPFGIENESGYKKVTVRKGIEYGDLLGLPTKVTESSSESGIDIETKYVYPNEANTLNLTTDQITINQSLFQKNIVNEPTEISKYKGAELLSKQRTLYKRWFNSDLNIWPEFIQTAKGVGTLESRIHYTDYNSMGFPKEVSLVDGTVTKFFYNYKNQVILKIENYTYSSGGDNFISSGLGNSFNSNCSDFNTYFPKSLFTIYEYNPSNDSIIRITDTNCIDTHYHYDRFNNLDYIKDGRGHILKKFDNNYRIQN